MLKSFLKILLFIFLTVINCYAYSFTSVTVTNLNDDGSAGTLREAINTANSDADIDEIIFSSGLTGTLTLTSDLPSITANLTITGPGINNMTISGANGFKMFQVGGGVILTISGITFSNNASFNGSVFRADNSNSSVVASNIKVTACARSYAFYTNNPSTITISNSTISANSSILFGSDYGSTPSNTSDTETDYQNRITVFNCTFSNNSSTIFSTERYVKIDGCTFTSNTGGIGSFRGLNRYQVLNSTFTNNSSTLFSFSSALSTGTFLSTLGANQHLFNGNIFSGNTGTVINTGSTNEQSKTTITNNTFSNNGTNWTGSPAVASDNNLDNFLTSVVHDLANSTIIVTTSKSVYAASGSTGALETSDFQFSLSGGNATLVSNSPTSISNSGNVYTLGISISGDISGAEILTVSPISNSIYDASNNIAGTIQKNATTKLSFLDGDQDGVANFLDQCPNTPTTEFVNPATGCSDAAFGKIWTGQAITFTKVAGADFTLSANQDAITSNVIITRNNASSGGLYNIAKETFYSSSTSMKDTKWVKVSSNNLTTSQIKALTYGSNWRTATTFLGTPTLNQYYLVYLVTDNVYLYVKILSWNSSGGFSYERSTQPTILSNFPNINKKFLDPSFTITAPSTNSSGAFSYTSNNPLVATISGNVVTIVGAGTTTITANQASNSTYAANSVAADLTVEGVNVVTKSGENSAIKSTFVDKNGALNTNKGLTKNGEVKTTKSN